MSINNSSNEIWKVIYFTNVCKRNGSKIKKIGWVAKYDIKTGLERTLSILKNNKAKAIRFSTLEDICKALDCQPGDILEFVEDDEE